MCLAVVRGWVRFERSLHGRPPKSISHLPSKHLFSSAKGEPPHLATKRWGLVEGYDKAEKPDLWRMFNARSETLHTSPVFRSLVKSKRWPLRTRLILGANSLNTFNMHMCMYLSHVGVESLELSLPMAGEMADAEDQRPLWRYPQTSHIVPQYGTERRRHRPIHVGHSGAVRDRDARASYTVRSDRWGRGPAPPSRVCALSIWASITVSQRHPGIHLKKQKTKSQKVNISTFETPTFETSFQVRLTARLTSAGSHRGCCRPSRHLQPAARSLPPLLGALRASSRALGAA